MKTLRNQALIGLAVTAAVGLLTFDGWPYYLVGAVMAVVLWFILFAGSYAYPPGSPNSAGVVTTRDFAIAAVLAVGIGYAIVRIADNPAFWTVGAIMAGAITPSAGVARAKSSAS